MKTYPLSLVVIVLVLAAPAMGRAAPGPPEDHERRRVCAGGRAERCGAGVVVGGQLRGVDNCSRDPTCRTRRIVDNADPLRGSDFLPVPQEAGPANAVPVPRDAAPATTCPPRPVGAGHPGLDRLDLPAGTIGASPRREHLTGLESWFWYDGPVTADWRSPAPAAAAAGCPAGPAASPRPLPAELVAWTWRLGDGRPATYRAARPGTQASPAVRHVYATKGTWTVTVDCTWQDEAGARLVVPCAALEVDVIEVRARLHHERSARG